jgi:hypothetical protein
MSFRGECGITFNDVENNSSNNEQNNALPEICTSTFQLGILGETGYIVLVRTD